MTYVYDFDEPCEEGRALLGGKGLGLAEMTQLGLPVPRGFTITTEACRVTMRTGSEPPALSTEVAEHLARLERATGKRFGDVRNPLLLSVRSGGPISMPGMMETVLNLGLNRRIVESGGFGADRRFAFDAYRRLLQMYGTVVAGIEADAFESVLVDVKARCGVDLESSLSADDLAGIAQRFEELYLIETPSAFPDQPYVQLGLAIQAVFESWNAPRAQVYRPHVGWPEYEHRCLPPTRQLTSTSRSPSSSPSATAERAVALPRHSRRDDRDVSGPCGAWQVVLLPPHRRARRDASSCTSAGHRRG